ncbi:MAG: fatty acid desaturase family protein [Bacteroidota bacterium]|jgi:linoleoyl-CoA desaturase
MNFKSVSFDRKQHVNFSQTLKKRINDYFQENKISRYANTQMVFKGILMTSIYLVPYILLLSLKIENPWVVLLIYSIMGVGVAGIGLNIMHDANHGVFSRNKTINTLLSLSMNFVGSSASMWRIQHNVLHHTFTNIDGMDEDTESMPFLLRFTPNQKRRPIHKYQHLYAWFFYTLMTLARILLTDFTKVFTYSKKGLIKTKKEFYMELSFMILSKAIYFGYVILIPVLILPVSWWVPIVGFVLMHLIAGFILAIIFQAAHIVPDAKFPVPNEGGEISEPWLVHELATTANFGTGNKTLTWLIGGLNFQVEHHLFSNISHVHYLQISKIVKETTKEYGLPYIEAPTFWSALVQHARMLKQLGRA